MAFRTCSRDRRRDAPGSCVVIEGSCLPGGRPDDPSATDPDAERDATFDERASPPTALAADSLFTVIDESNTYSVRLGRRPPRSSERGGYARRPEQAESEQNTDE